MHSTFTTVSKMDLHYLCIEYIMLNLSDNINIIMIIIVASIYIGSFSISFRASDSRIVLECYEVVNNYVVRPYTNRIYDIFLKTAIQQHSKQIFRR